MYFEDLSDYQYDLSVASPEVKNVGWLAEGQPFKQGRVSQSFLEKLKLTVLRESVNQYRGRHYCEFCLAEEVWIEADNQRKCLGSAEVWVPCAKGDLIYAAPNFVLHYIEAHTYLPPIQFIEAVERFDLSEEWSGCSERQKVVSELV